MSKLDLSKYGITDVKEILHNPSYEELFKAETDPSLTGYEKGQVTELGAVNVMTGIYTGRSPKDKFFVKNEASEKTVWWTSEEYKNDNKPCSEEAWADLKAKAVKELSGKKLYVVDTFCGANAGTRLKVRFIMEVACPIRRLSSLQSAVFLINSCSHRFSEASSRSECFSLHATKAHLIPKLRCQFAEFLLPSSLKRLSIFNSPTSVGLRYGHMQAEA